VYLPNLGVDPEQQGLPLMERIKRLIVTVLADVKAEAHFSALDYLLLDDVYDYGVVDVKQLNDLNIMVIKTPLIAQKVDKYDERLVAKALLSFA
jgi:hypothetical protein